jgi:6-phosphogluconolactonase (cycloisomerase 2 family)
MSAPRKWRVARRREDMMRRRLGALVLLSCLAGGVQVEASRLGFVGIVQNGIGGVDGLGGPIAMAVSPDGVHAYVASEPDSAVVVLRRDAKTGALSFVQRLANGLGGVTGLGVPTGPRAIDVTPDGRHVYVAAAADSAVAVFRRDAGAGTLDFVEAKRDGVDGVDGLNGAWSVAVSPDGRHLYAAGFADQAVAVFARDETTGALRFVEAQFNGSAGVFGLDDP